MLIYDRQTRKLYFAHLIYPAISVTMNREFIFEIPAEETGMLTTTPINKINSVIEKPKLETLISLVPSPVF